MNRLSTNFIELSDGLEERCTPANLSLALGIAAQLPIGGPVSAAVGVPAAKSISFNGPILDIPASMAEGRILSVVFADGTTIAGRIQRVDLDRVKLFIARELPVSDSWPSTMFAEARLTNRLNASDQILVGIQIRVALESALTNRANVIVESTPIYSQATAQEEPTSPPEPTDKPPAIPSAPITHSPFEAGPVRTDFVNNSIRGVRSTVPLSSDRVDERTKAAPSDLPLGYLRASSWLPSEEPSDRRTAIEQVESNTRRALSIRVQPVRSESIPIAIPITHGVALKEIEYSDAADDLRDILVRMANEDRAAVWTEADSGVDEPTTSDSRPYWILASILGLGASQYFRSSREPSEAESFII